MSDLSAFSPDYGTARERFRAAADRLGWQLESHAIEAVGPDGGQLTIDVGSSTGGDPERVLVVTSGLHGVEGFFGSAVQLALLEAWAAGDVPSTKCVFLHGLNPYGFAWRRRFNEGNVDPNRNFLLPDEPYEGAPDGYARFDPLLNPQRTPSLWEPFALKALWLIIRYGTPALRQAVAAGQYDFPRGLFFGGSEPSETHRLLNEHMPRLLEGSRRVVHLDFHTGLGGFGAWKLLIDYHLEPWQHDCLRDWFGPDSYEATDPSGISYDARGGLGQWCVARGMAPEYLYALAEFGTYRAVKMLAGLRSENQAHHWGEPTGEHAWTRDRLVELFCPASKSWRHRVLADGTDLVNRAWRGLAAS